MEGWPQIDDLLFASGALDLNPELTSNDWNSLPLNTPYHTNDAAFADVHLGAYADTSNSNLFDTYTYPTNPNLYDLDELPALDDTCPDILPINWDFMMPTTMDDPPTSITTMASSCNTTEPSDYAPTYITSPTSMTQSPTGLPQSQVSGKLTENDADKTASTKTRRRRTKMKAGTRPCDLKRQKRKEDKPEQCHICKKGHQWKRDLDRHYRSHHPDEAAKMGLSLARPICRHCGDDFSRRDHLKRHVKKRHGGD